MGSSPLWLDRQHNFSAVHQPCRLNVENIAWPWFKLSVFAPPTVWRAGIENNGGRLAAREIERYSANPFINFLARPSDWISSCRWTRKPRERNAELVEEQKQARSENDLLAPNFAPNFASIPSPDCLSLQSWTPLSSGTAPRALPSSPAPFSASSVVPSSSSALMMFGASLPARAPFAI